MLPAIKSGIKILVFVCLSFYTSTSFAQEQSHAKADTPYFLPSPEGWEHEVFPLPPDFAKALTVHGTEDIRFTPGWGDTTSADHWAYTFLWWLDRFEKRFNKGPAGHDL